MTGFGPFKSGSDSDNTGINHVKNASWEGVKVLKERWSELATDGKTTGAFFVLDAIVLMERFV